MAQTRAATGNSKPRVFPSADEVAVKSKANTSKPRTKKTTGGRVGKAPAATTTKKTAGNKKTKTGKIAEKLEGAALKAEGAILNKPGKKAAGTAKVKGTERKAVAPKTKAAKA